MSAARATNVPEETRKVLVLSMLVGTLVGGCSFWGSDEAAGQEDCASEEEYQTAPVAPELSVPAGLDRPDPSTRLDVPGGPIPAEPLAKTAACLQRPPNYFDKPLNAPAK